MNGSGGFDLPFLKERERESERESSLLKNVLFSIMGNTLYNKTSIQQGPFVKRMVVNQPQQSAFTR